MVEKQIIKLFCEDKELFTKYYKYVNINYIKINYNNIYKLFITINNYYTTYSNSNNINSNDLEVVYNSNYLLKDSERNDFNNLVSEILSLEVNKDVVIELLEEHRRRSLSGDVAKLALDVEEIGRAHV
jgi:hypothetical protein